MIPRVIRATVILRGIRVHVLTPRTNMPLVNTAPEAHPRVAVARGVQGLTTAEDNPTKEHKIPLPIIL